MKAREPSAAHASPANGATPRGAVFYHTQDLERGVAGEGLMLGFGVFHEDNDGDLEGNARLGQEVCQVLAAHGVVTARLASRPCARSAGSAAGSRSASSTRAFSATATS